MVTLEMAVCHADGETAVRVRVLLDDGTYIEMVVCETCDGAAE